MSSSVQVVKCAGERGGHGVRGAVARQAAPARHQLAEERDRRDARHPHPHHSHARRRQIAAPLYIPLLIHSSFKSVQTIIYLLIIDVMSIEQ